MTFRERLPRWLGGKPAPPTRGATGPIGFDDAAAENFGPGIGNQPSHEALLRESIGVPARAERAIANRVSTLNPLVKVSRSVRGGTDVD